MRSTSITKVQDIVWRLPASVRLPLHLVTVIATPPVPSSSGTTVRLFESRDDRRGFGSLDMMIQGGIAGSRGDCDKYSQHGHMSTARKSKHAHCAGTIWFTLWLSVLCMRSKAWLATRVSLRQARHCKQCSALTSSSLHARGCAYPSRTR
jgi:hypothetical protein